MFKVSQICKKKRLTISKKEKSFNDEDNNTSRVNLLKQIS